MTTTDLLVLNLDEIRRRSLKIWAGIPADRLRWKPDAGAMSCIELVRHVLEGEFLYASMLREGGSLASDETPFTSRPFVNIDDEIAFAAPFRHQFLELVKSFS